MTKSSAQLILNLDGGSDATAEDVVSLAQTLRNDLLELDIQAVDMAERETPDGSKTGLAIDWTTLFVTLVASEGVITTVISTIQAWLMRNRMTTVTLKLAEDELTITGTGPYSEMQEQAIRTWLNRYKGFVIPNE